MRAFLAARGEGYPSDRAHVAPMIAAAMARLEAEGFDVAAYAEELRSRDGARVSGPQQETYEAQLSGRVAEMLPDLATPERLELLGAMDPDDLRASLAFIASHYPQIFDFTLVHDEAMVGRLEARLDEDQADDEEPYCGTCGAAAGIFLGHGDGWHHYRGEGTPESRTELFDAGHEPVIAWRMAGAVK